MTITIDEVFETAIEHGYNIWPTGMYVDQLSRACCPVYALGRRSGFTYNEIACGRDRVPDIAVKTGLDIEWLRGVICGFENYKPIDTNSKKIEGIKFGQACRERAFSQNTSESL